MKELDKKVCMYMCSVCIHSTIWNVIQLQEVEQNYVHVRCQFTK